MADDGASDTRYVATKEGHAGLLEAIKLLLGLPQRLVDLLNCGLKCGKLDHGVWDLTRPEWVEALVESAEASVCVFHFSRHYTKTYPP